MLFARRASATMRFSARIALVACVASGSVAAQAGNGATPTISHELETTHVNLEGVSFDIAWTRDRGVSEHKLLVPADVAWAAFPTVFGELGIDPNIIDSRQMLFGNAGAIYRRKIAGQRLSHYIECGNMLGVSTADSYDVWLRIVAQVLPTDGGLSRLRVELQATAKATDRPGGSVPCASNGFLEARIAKMLSAEAAKSAP